VDERETDGGRRVGGEGRQGALISMGGRKRGLISIPKPFPRSRAVLLDSEDTRDCYVCASPRQFRLPPFYSCPLLVLFLHTIVSSTYCAPHNNTFYGFRIDTFSRRAHEVWELHVVPLGYEPNPEPILRTRDSGALLAAFGLLLRL